VRFLSSITAHLVKLTLFPRHAPPTDSKPEAANFPEMHYEMSNDTAPFVPPQRYPSPPKNMWYEVPKERPAAPAAPPRAIFPWETHRPRASRVFADLPPEPPAADEPKTEPTSEHAAPPESSPQASSGEPHSQGEGAGTSSNHVTPPASEVWSSFSNAWDDVPQIGQYVDKLQQRHRRTKSQGMNLGNLPPPSGLTQEDVNQRRGSKLTDFPTEVERPSLPVTPAPIRRPRFWGGGGPGTSIGAGEEDEDNELLPAAEGVPAQSEWVCAHGIRWSPADCLCDLANVLRYHKDPMAQLQKLAQQQSDLVLQKFGGESKAEDESNTTGIEGREIPNRSLPFGSEDAKSPTYVAQSPTVHSPTPVKPGSGTSLAARLQSENDSTPRSTYEDGSAVMEEPSYHGPGAAFEKGEDYLTQDTPAPPTEEEQDVLDT
jgi:glycogenin glucosyltransferase